MNSYVTGGTIKRLREGRRLTQARLAELLGVTDKAVSKWETGRGLPDLTLLEPLAKALGISVPELLSGEQVVNANRAANLLRAPFYVCPVCGNVIHASGAASGRASTGSMCSPSPTRCARTTISPFWPASPPGGLIW